MKSYSQSPLPFMGQKRKFAKDFKTALKEFDDKTVFVDLFGGSGLLSHIIKRERPDALVVYNDFDDYHIRLQNVERTNAILKELRVIVKDLPSDKKLSEETKEVILTLLKEAEKDGFVDYITLSSSLLFSMNYAKSNEEMAKQTMYNCVRLNDYDCAGYLDGLEITKEDYVDLFNKYKMHPRTVFIVDPPYLSTDCNVYKGYWRLGDYLDVLNVLKDSSFVYFTSNKSQIIELCEWTEKNLNAENPFKNAIRKEMSNNPTINSRFTDIMLYKKRSITGFQRIFSR